MLRRQEERKNFFDFLFERGLVYRYSQERFAQLQGGGQPYPSPTRIVGVNGQNFVEELIQPVLTPVVFSKEETARLEKLVRVYGKFLKVQFEFFKAVKAGEVNGFISELVRKMCTEDEWQFGLVNSGYDEILPFVRFDCLRTQDGFLVVDINSTRPAGVGDCVVLSRGYKEFGFDGRSFSLEQCFADAVRNCFEQWRKGKSGGDGYGVLVRKSDGDWHNFRILAECLNRAGFAAELIDNLDVSGFKTIVRSRIKEGDSLFTQLAGLYPDSLCVISPLYRRFLGNKLWMYLIHLPQAQDFFVERLGSEDFAFLKKFFPEIGIMDGNQICLADGRRVELTAKNRKEWVIKAPAGSSANGMIFGLMNEDRWRSLVSGDLSGCIVQRFYRSMEKFPVVGKNGEVAEENLYTKYGVFILGGKLAGCEVMARRHHIVHGARNTYFSVCFEERRPAEGPHVSYSDSNHPPSCKCWNCIGSASRFATDED
ncbi:MAG: hypothetical protein AB1465_06075 [Patescibacteria group bacterium]